MKVIKRILFCFRKMDESVNAHLKQFVCDSNTVLDLKLIREAKDIEDDEISFEPEMSHQVFGDR